MGTVRFVRQMSESTPFDVILVEGNHEDKHKRYRLNLNLQPNVAKQQAIHSLDTDNHTRSTS